jgi:bifunctional DNase/RNase
MTLMRVRGVSRAPESPNVLVVLETVAEGRTLGFMTPHEDANRLTRVLGLTPCRCTPVYDLVLALVARLEASVNHALIDASDEGIVATLVLDRHGARLVHTCHPIDALALALHQHAPVYATPDAVARTCPPGPHAHGPSPHLHDVSAWLEAVRPDDFSTTDEAP